MAGEGNGNVIRYRLDRAEHRIRNVEQGAQLISKFGQRNNEQIKVHDERLREVDRRLEAVEADVSELPVVRTKLENLEAKADAARNAGYAVVVALVGLMGTVVWQTLQ